MNFGDFIGPIILYFKNYHPIKIKPKNLFSHGDNIFNKKAKLKIKFNPGFYQRSGDNNKVFKIQPGINNFVTNKNHGYVKFIDDNGYCYIGQVVNGLKHGKGTLYYKSEIDKYEGYWVNDKREGNGKHTYENGDYYIGQYKNNLKHGKGTLYFKNGKIKYQGDYFNGKIEGNGKYYFKNGEYYIGQFKNI